MLQQEKSTALRAVVSASRLCQSVQTSLVQEGVAGSGTQVKQDKSPVTLADFGAQALVSHVLNQDFPEFLMVGEENADELRADDVLRNRMMDEISRIEPMLTENIALELIDRGSYEGGATGVHWVLDPIDGTKGFLRGDQYAVALGLIEDGEVVLACLVVQIYHVRMVEKYVVQPKDKVLRCTIWMETRLVQMVHSWLSCCNCESVEKGHSSHSHSSQIAEKLGITEEPYQSTVSVICRCRSWRCHYLSSIANQAWISRKDLGSRCRRGCD